MAHDHRMNPVGEPHLNSRPVKGRSDLPRLKKALVNKRVGDWNTMFGNSFGPPDVSGYEQSVNKEVTDYRRVRNRLQAQGKDPMRSEKVSDLQWQIKNARYPQKEDEGY